MGHQRRTVTCYRCGLAEARRSDDGLPRGWVSAIVTTGRDAQAVVYVCPRCPLPAGTLNPQTETQARHARH